METLGAVVFAATNGAPIIVGPDWIGPTTTPVYRPSATAFRRNTRVRGRVLRLALDCGPAANPRDRYE